MRTTHTRVCFFIVAAFVASVAACSSETDPVVIDDVDAAVTTPSDASSTSVDARPGTTLPDAAPPPPDAPPTVVEDPIDRLTPTSYTISDFALGSRELVVRAVLGTHRIWRCPLAGCPASPTVIAEPLVRLPGAVSIAGDAVYFDESEGRRLRRVGLDGQGLATVIDDRDVGLSSDFVATRGHLYAGFLDSDTRSQGVLEVEGDDVFPLEAAETGFFGGEVAASSSWLVFVPWGSGPKPVQAWSFTDGARTTGGTITSGGTGRSLAVAGDVLFWADDRTLRACQLPACASPVVVAAGVADLAITTDGARVYFAKQAAPVGILQSCPAVAAACPSPRVHGQNRRWLLPRRLRVDADYIYGIDDASTAVWRAAK